MILVAGIIIFVVIPTIIIKPTKCAALMRCRASLGSLPTTGSRSCAEYALLHGV